MNGELVDPRTTAMQPGTARQIWAAGETARPAEADADELARLAETVLRHSHDDLSALAEADPGIVARWIEAFAQLKAKAEADARLWSAAMASLSTASSPLLSAGKATA